MDGVSKCINLGFDAVLYYNVGSAVNAEIRNLLNNYNANGKGLILGVQCIGTSIPAIRLDYGVSNYSNNFSTTSTAPSSTAIITQPSFDEYNSIVYGVSSFNLI